MRWIQEGKWITGGFALILLLMGGVSLVSYQNAMELIESASQVRQTNDLLDNLNDIESILAEMESRRWNYILFGDDEEFVRYKAGIQPLWQKIDKLKIPFSDTPEQQQRLTDLTLLIDQRLDLLQQSIDRYSNGQTLINNQEPLILKTKQNRDQIWQLLTELKQEEEEILQNQVGRSQLEFQWRIVLEVLGTLLTFLVLLGVYALLYRQLVKRQQAEMLQQSLTQAKELSEMKLQFFSMVSHEFRTPLSIILGCSQLLEESLQSLVEASRLKNLYKIQSSAKVMKQLLSDILTLARADAGKLEINLATLELQTFCLNLIEDFQLASQPQRSFNFTQKGSRTHANLDEKLLYSILSNILSNAIKYSPSNSTVHFTLMGEPDIVIFQIRDEGIGIAEADRLKLYEPFSRGRNAKGISGTGLGLAVVKRCLDLHQGKFLIDSTPGLGTIVTVKIPQSAQLEPTSGHQC